MRSSVSTLLAAVVLVAGCCLSSGRCVAANLITPPCVMPAQDFSLTVKSSHPNSNQTIDISVGEFEAELWAASANVQLSTNSIAVNFYGSAQGGNLAGTGRVGCVTVTIGPLPPGVYSVGAYQTTTRSGTVRVISTQFAVTPANDGRSCFLPTASVPLCVDLPGCLYACPAPPVSSAKVNFTAVLNQIPADACVPTTTTSVLGSAITISGNFVKCAAPSRFTYPSLEPLAAGHYDVNFTVAPDPSYGATSVAPTTLTTGLDVAASLSDRPNYQGLWWAAPAGSQPGWGLNMTHQGNLIFMSWFSFDAGGKAHWWVATLTQTDTNIFAGALYDGSGPPFNTMPFPPLGQANGAIATVAGSAKLTFTDSNNASFLYSVDGTQIQPITREVFGPLPHCTFGDEPNLALARNYTDLWWASPAGSEAGWGVNISHQGDTAFATWFTYDVDRTPMWLVSQVNKTADGVYEGPLIKAISGSPLYVTPYVPLGAPGGAVGTVVGSARFAFSDGNNALFTYSVGNVTQTKPITRQVLLGYGTVCQ